MESRMSMVLAAASVILVAGPVMAGQGLVVEPRTAGDVRYMNGGFGLEERGVMDVQYPLKLVFATDRGNYLSRVQVAVSDGAGKKVAEVAADDGPWLLLALGAGTYTVEATHNGHRKVLKGVVVPATGMVTVQVTWATAEVDMGLPAGK